MARTSSDPLKAFTALRTSLEAERARLTGRLAEIEAALGTVVAVTEPKAARKAAVPGKRKRAQNELSLKDAVLQAVAKQALTKAEILAAVKKLGYQFTAKDPVNSLNTLLYGKNPKFSNKDGKFSAA